MPDITIRFDALIVEADLVAMHCTIQGTHLGEWRGVPPTGRHATWTATVFRRVSDGQLVEGLGTWDMLGLLQQLDVIGTQLEPANPAPPASGVLSHDDSSATAEDSLSRGAREWAQSGTT